MRKIAPNGGSYADKKGNLKTSQSTAELPRTPYMASLRKAGNNDSIYVSLHLYNLGMPISNFALKNPCKSTFSRNPK